jgi:hypothetical protein
MIDKYNMGIKFMDYSSRNISYTYNKYSSRPYESRIEPDNSQVIRPK